jgi:hypothetical protein
LVQEEQQLLIEDPIPEDPEPAKGELEIQIEQLKKQLQL